MLDVCLRIFGPLLMVFGRALGLRLFRDAAMEMLSARDELNAAVPGTATPRARRSSPSSRRPARHPGRRRRIAAVA